MKYYLDTNAIYHINKIPESILQNSFYSVFGLIEIVAGLNETEFIKRKKILSSAINSVAKCDYTFPEQLIFNAFDCFTEYEFSEQRIDDLFGIIKDIISSNSFAEFHTPLLLKERKFDFYYFVQRDKFYSENFLSASVKGNEMIAAELKNSSGKAMIKLADKEYDLSSRRAIVNFLNNPLVNSSFTILSLADSAMNIAKENLGKISERKVYKSYNGNLSVFIEGSSAYYVNQIINNEVPNKNDFQDLIHMFYLRNNIEIKIVSNDTLFIKCIPARTISVNDLRD